MVVLWPKTGAPGALGAHCRLCLAWSATRGLQRSLITFHSPVRRALVRDLVRYLLENAYIDFRGDIAMDRVRQFLREDDSRESRALLAKLIEDKGVDDLLLALADVLKEYIQVGVTEDVVREQLMTYSES